MVRRRKPKFRKVEALEACFCELLHLEVGKEDRSEAGCSRLAAGPLKMRVEKEMIGMRIWSPTDPEFGQRAS
jgi:hypothetical protein